MIPTIKIRCLSDGLEQNPAPTPAPFWLTPLVWNTPHLGGWVLPLTSRNFRVFAVPGSWLHHRKGSGFSPVPHRSSPNLLLWLAASIFGARWRALGGAMQINKQQLDVGDWGFGQPQNGRSSFILVIFHVLRNYSNLGVGGESFFEWFVKVGHWQQMLVKPIMMFKDPAPPHCHCQQPIYYRDWSGGAVRMWFHQAGLMMACNSKAVFSKALCISEDKFLKLFVSSLLLHT